MPPTRFSPRAYRAKLASQSHGEGAGAGQVIPMARRGPAAAKKSVRASGKDKLRYASFEESAREFDALRQQLEHLEHLPWDILEFNEHTAVSDRVAAACRYRGIDDALLHPQMFITEKGQKIVHCHVCEEDFSVSNFSKVKVRHSSSDEHLAQLAQLLHIELFCLRNMYNCYLSTCNWSVGGEREDALLRHYKTVHLGLRNDESVPLLIRESLEEYRIAIQLAASTGTTPDVSLFNIPSRLPSPVNAPSPIPSTSSSSSLSPSPYPSPASPASCCSSAGPSTPVEDPLYEWASSSPSPSNSPAPASDWSLDFDISSYLPQPEVFTPTTTTTAEYDSSFLFDPAQPFVPSLYDFSAIPLVEDNDKDDDNDKSLGLTELLNSPLSEFSVDWDVTQSGSGATSTSQTSPTSFDSNTFDFDFDFSLSQTPSFDDDLDLGLGLNWVGV